MLPAAHRMRRSSDFTATVRHGSRAGRPRLVVHLADSPGPGSTTVGFVVSRAVGGAVTRNRVKRRLRHLVMSRLDRLPPGSRVVVRALAPSARATNADLAADLDRALDRAAATRPPARSRT